MTQNLRAATLNGEQIAAYVNAVCETMQRIVTSAGEGNYIPLALNVTARPGYLEIRYEEATVGETKSHIYRIKEMVQRVADTRGHSVGVTEHYAAGYSWIELYIRDPRSWGSKQEEEFDV